MILALLRRLISTWEPVSSLGFVLTPLGLIEMSAFSAEAWAIGAQVALSILEKSPLPSNANHAKAFTLQSAREWALPLTMEPLACLETLSQAS